MHPTQTLERVLKTIALTRHEGFLCRAVNVNALYRFSHTAHYTPRPLYNLGPPRGGARFTPRGGAPSLYLADDYETSLREYLQVGWPAGLAPASTENAFVCYVAEVRLETVLDLTKRTIRNTLATDLRELKGPWRYRRDGRVPPTHRLGRAVAKVGHIQAIRFAAGRGRGACFAILTDTLTPPAYVRIRDPKSRLMEQIPGE
jgi:RES domain-containing protein